MNVVQVKHGQAVWLRVAAVLYALSLSWPVHIPTLQYVLRARELPLLHMFGQTFHGLDGPIMHAWGPNAIIASILAFGIASAFEVLAGYWLWKRQRRGATLALVLLPIYWFFCDRLGRSLYVAHWCAESNCTGIRLEECALRTFVK